MISSRCEGGLDSDLVSSVSSVHMAMKHDNKGRSPNAFDPS
jgi:hypothetical protein